MLTALRITRAALSIAKHIAESVALVLSLGEVACTEIARNLGDHP